MTEAERMQLIEELLQKAQPDREFIAYWQGVHDRAEAVKRAIKERSILYGPQPRHDPPSSIKK